MSTSKSVSKTGLSAFLRENSELNLTQSKALAERLLRGYDIVLKPPATGETTVIAGQTWRDSITHRIVVVTRVDVGPQIVPDDPVVAWGPQSIHWEDSTHTGIADIGLWRERMVLQEGTAVTPLDADTQAKNERSHA